MSKPLICPKCHVEVDESHSHCPVCGRFLKDVSHTEKQSIYPTPNYKTLERKNSTILQSIFAFPLLSALLVTLLIDLLLIRNNFGTSFLVTFIVFYLWIFIYQTLLSNQGIGAKILWQILGLSLLLLMIGFVTERTLNTWPLQYVIPILMSVANVLFFIIVTIQRRTDVILFQSFVMSLLSMVPFGLYLFALNAEQVPGFIAFLLGLINIIALFTYLRKKFFAYIQRWLHI